VCLWGRFLRDVLYCSPPESLGLLIHLLFLFTVAGQTSPRTITCLLKLHFVKIVNYGTSACGDGVPAQKHVKFNIVFLKQFTFV
jgi:hypothetical protein